MEFVKLKVLMEKGVIQMASGIAVGKGNVAEIATYLEEGLVGLHTEKVYANESQIGNEQVILQVYERYYHRNKQRATLTVLISGKNDDVRVEAVGAGGGGGLFMRITLGANNDFAFRVGDLLRVRDFEITSYS